MKKIVSIASVLSWICLVVWGLICVFGLLFSLATGNLPLIASAFLLSSVVLHAYAALQLHKSIRNPAIPLGRQTSAGIRFVGFAALFFGLLYVTYSLAIIQRPQDLLQTMGSSMPQAKDVTTGAIRACGVFILLLGLCPVVNVILNFRLLRWYSMWKESDNQDKS